MPGAIQRFPGALLPLLSIKAAETPRVLLDGELATVDMLPLYLCDRQEVVSQTLVGITNPSQQSIPVPAGEYWWVYGINAIASNISAPATIKLSCGVATPGQPGNPLAMGAMVTPATSVATETYYIPAVVPPILLLPPGSFVYAACVVDPGVPTFDLTCRALIARLSPNS